MTAINYSLEEVRAKIIEAVPEILELKFGCHIQKFDRVMKFVELTSFDDGSHSLSFVAPNGTLHNATYFTNEIEELVILGRPITLEDVLKAMNTPRKDGKYYCNDTDYEKVFWLWVWGKPLDQQHPETITFIGKVLISP
jgi:hypothetical protein